MTDAGTDLGTDLDTDLDRAQERANTGDDGARLAFFRLLADTPLLILLEREAVDEVLEPRLFDLEEGKLALAFDLEERLARMGEGPLPYAEIPGRVLARLLAAEGLGLGLNLGAGTASEMLLPHSAMIWLSQMLEPQPEAQHADLGDVQPPAPDLLLVMQRVLAGAPETWGGLAEAAHLYQRAGRGVILVEGADPDAEIALATALSEALRFSEAGETSVDIAFATGRSVPAGGTRLDWPKVRPAPQMAQTGPAAPGMDSSRPPKLR